MKKALTIFILIIAIMTTGCTKKADVDAPTDGITDVQPTEGISKQATDNPEETPEITPTELPTEVPTEEPGEYWEDELYYNNGNIVTPWVDSALKENLTGDITLSAKEDFHLYVNYDWLKNTEIPAGNMRRTFFDEASEQVDENELALISDESIEGHDAKLVRDLYSAIVDWDERNARGIEPLVQMIEEIEAIETLDQLTDMLCDSEKGRFLPKLIDIYISPALSDSSKYIVTVAAMEHVSPIGIRFNGNYVATEKKFFARMMERAGYSTIDAAQMYDSAINRIWGSLSWNPYGYEAAAEADFTVKNTVTVSRERLQSITKNYPMMRILESQGCGDLEEYQVYNLEVVKNLDKIYTPENLRFLKKYMIVECVMSMSPFLDQETLGYISDYTEEIFGASANYYDKTFALIRIEIYLDGPLSNIYLQKYDVAGLKERIMKLSEQVIDEYKVMLSAEDWLSEEMRAYAIEKLDTVKILAICPEETTDYSDLDLDGLSYFDAIKTILDYYNENRISQLGKPVDEYKWMGSVLDTNACYNLQNNSICIPLGILAGEFYYEGISDEELYATIGTIIGHELSHAFDTKGALYDKNGDYKDWWVKEDYSAFQKRADRLVKYFNHMTGFWGGAVNGQLVSGEAIADIAGMKVILQLAEKKENFDYEKFFTTYAKHWRSLSTEAYERYCLSTDPHPLDYLRTNAVLQQFDIFFETFDIHEGDNMYLAPKSRVSVW